MHLTCFDYNIAWPAFHVKISTEEAVRDASCLETQFQLNQQGFEEEV